jgi:hypothetical protein
MSAFVAFNGFPGQSEQDSIGTLLVKERQAPVAVPARPRHVGAASSHTGRDATRRSGSGVRHAHGPVARSAPVSSPTQGSQPSGTQSPSTGSAAQQPVTAPTAPVDATLPTGSTPSLPTTSVPSLPPVDLTPVTQTASQLPVDTSGVTGVLGQ